MDLDPEPAARLEQGWNHGAGVDLVSDSTKHAAAHRRGKPRLEVARLARAEPLHRQAELPAELELALERGLLVAVDCHVKRPGLAIAGQPTGIELELGDERGISSGPSHG